MIRVTAKTKRNAVAERAEHKEQRNLCRMPKFTFDMFSVYHATISHVLACVRTCACARVRRRVRVCYLC